MNKNAKGANSKKRFCATLLYLYIGSRTTEKSTTRLLRYASFLLWRWLNTINFSNSRYSLVFYFNKDVKPGCNSFVKWSKISLTGIFCPFLLFHSSQNGLNDTLQNRVIVLKQVRLKQKSKFMQYLGSHRGSSFSSSYQAFF